VPAALARATVDAALAHATGAKGAAAAHVTALAKGVTAAMSLTKKKVATALVLIASLLAAGTAALCRQGVSAKEPPHTRAKPAPRKEAAKLPEAVKRPAADDKESLVYGGRVVGPDGRPVAGAKLYLTPAWGSLKWPSPSPQRATTGPDGRFEF